MIRLILVALLLSGCVTRYARPCSEALQEPLRTVDEIMALRRAGVIDEDRATKLLAMSALTIRAVTLTREDCR